MKQEYKLQYYMVFYHHDSKKDITEKIREKTISFVEGFNVNEAKQKLLAWIDYELINEDGSKVLVEDIKPIKIRNSSAKREIIKTGKYKNYLIIKNMPPKK